MSGDAFDDLKNHFKAMAIELKSKGEQASVFAHTSDTGTEREEAYRTFLERHLPKICDVFLGGYIFDMNGHKSSQMDIIVTDGYTPRFVMPDGSKHIAHLEGSLAVVEVKSNLDKESIHKALRGCASIPEMPDLEGRINPMFKLSADAWVDLPYKIIFAYDGIEPKITLNHINRFYDENDCVPLHRRPNIIHVLNKYIIIRRTAGTEISNSDGSVSDVTPEIGEYAALTEHSDVSAMLWIINALHQNAFVANHIMYKFDVWHNDIVMRLMHETV